jgi:DNA-binding NarL/FixJ family response regulator
MSTLLICDDHRVVREALLAVVSSLPSVTRVVAVATAAELMSAHRALEPDCVLLDASLLQYDDAGVCVRLLREPGARLLLLNANDGGLEALGALDSGAKGCLPSQISVAALSGALDVVLDGGDLLPESRRRALAGYLPAMVRVLVGA